MPKGIKMEQTGVFATAKQIEQVANIERASESEECLARLFVDVDEISYCPHDKDHFVHLLAIGHGLPGLPDDEPLRRYELNEEGEFVLAAPVWRKRKEKKNSEFRMQNAEESGGKKEEGKKGVKGEQGKGEGRRLKEVDKAKGKNSESGIQKSEAGGGKKEKKPTRGRSATGVKQEDLLVELCNRTEEVNKIRNVMLSVRTELEGIEFDFNKRKEAFDECVAKYAESLV